MNTDDIHGLSGAYAVDAVDDVERSRFEDHLANCSQCQSEVAGLRAAAGELSLATATPPPPSLRASLLRNISSVRPLPPEVAPEKMPAPDWPTPTPTPAPVWTIPTAPRTPSATEESESTSAAAPASLERKRAERAGRAPLRRWLIGVAAAAVLATGGLVWNPLSPETKTVQLTATEQVLQAKDAQRFEQKVGDATATIVRSPGLKRAVIVTANLADAPAGKVYELWLKQGPAMVRAGLIPAGGANTVLLAGDAASAEAVGITVEPAGGSDTPTLPPVAVISFA